MSKEAASSVWSIPHRIARLGSDHQLITRELTDHSTEHDLGPTPRTPVTLRELEVLDAELERAEDVGTREPIGTPLTEVGLSPQRDLRQLQATVTRPSIAYLASPTLNAMRVR